MVGQMLGHYRLVELIGQGGMATVYRALDTRSLQDVAIKILSSAAVGDRRYVRRFLPELRDVPRRFVHRPWEAPRPPTRYPAPLVDHAVRRRLALERFQAARAAASR